MLMPSLLLNANKPASHADSIGTIEAEASTRAIAQDMNELANPARPIVVDLFAGAGGLSLGFEMGGFDVVSAVEYDPVHAATHLYNFPASDLLCMDIAHVTKEAVLESARRGWASGPPIR